MEREEYKMYSEPSIPFCFLYLFNAYIEMYGMCGEDGLTWIDINNYAQVRNTKFTQIEIDYIIKCNSWANGQIKLMKEESDLNTKE